MENNEINPKPQSTGGLTLMTIFIAVLALHVVVIVGFTVYHYYFMGSTAADADVADNKALPKEAKVAADGSVTMESSLADGGQASSADNAPSTPPAPAIEQTTPGETASASAPIAPATVANAATPTGPVVTPTQPPAPEPAAPETTAPVEPATAPPLEPETPVVPVANSNGSYVVKMHDTLAKIAYRFHTTVAKLKLANGLRGQLLHVGEHLIIPVKTEVATAPATDTASPTNLSGTPATMADKPVATSAPVSLSHRTYTVVKGDTLIKIAHKFRTTAKALMEANNITDPTKLSIGRKLRIPSREAQATTTVTPVHAPAPVAAPATTPAATPSAPETATATAQLTNFVVQ
ncbi:MAG TPA: LysM peptidoglycan-binding domain-containing protein [Candidatus Methylacidiphilales bacterium]|nr:LysM peptidoglycan-binding domain-containing protein [Candidatus Methylacidiphilales bacterium]